MALFGSSETKIKPEDAIPGFVEDLLDPAFGQLLDVYRRTKNNAYTPQQRDALAQMEALARANTGLGGGVDVLSGLFGGGGLQTPAAQLGNQLTRGQVANPAAQGAAGFARNGGGVNPALAEVQRFAATGGGENPALAGAGRIGATGGGLNPAFGGAQRLAQTGGGTNPALSGFQSIAGGGAVNPALGLTQRIASGSDVGGNPFLDATFGRAADRVTSAFRDITAPAGVREAAASGRLGSGTYAQLLNRDKDVVGESLADLATGIYGQGYQTDRANQMAALGQLGSLGQADVTNRLSALGNIGSLGQAQVQNQFQGLGLVGQLGQQNVANQLAGLGLQGDLAQQQAGNRLAGLGLAGQLGEQQFGRQLQGLGLQANIGQQDIQNRLAGAGLLDQGIGRQLQGIGLGGIADQLRYLGPERLFQTGQTIFDEQFSVPERILRAGAPFAGIGGGAVGSQPGTGITGSQLLGAAAGLGSAFLLSDERAKTDVKKVGSLPLYEYRYKGEPEGTKRRGLMAQEVAEEVPDAVRAGLGGWLMVDYGRLAA